MFMRMTYGRCIFWLVEYYGRKGVGDWMIGGILVQTARSSFFACFSYIVIAMGRALGMDTHEMGLTSAGNCEIVLSRVRSLRSWSCDEMTFRASNGALT